MTPWQMIEARYPLVNAELKTLKCDLCGAVGLIMMAEALHEKIEKESYVHQPI